MNSTPDLHSLDDETLANQAGSAPAVFAILYERYLPPVYRYIYRRLGNAREAEDITAQVFMDALESLAARRYPPNTCFAAWLFTIARRRLVDSYRRPGQWQLDEELPAGPFEPFTAIENQQDQHRLAQLMDRLDEEKRELIRLRFGAGLSFASIAELDGRSVPAVKMGIYRALEWLRDHWENTS